MGLTSIEKDPIRWMNKKTSAGNNIMMIAITKGSS